jgi:hypothetical protein
MKRLSTIFGALLLIAGLAATVRANRFVASSRMAHGVVFGLPSRVEEHSSHTDLMERALIFPEDSIQKEIVLTGCEKDAPCYPAFLFRADEKTIVFHQFSCAGPLKYLEWGFPYIARCVNRTSTEAYWGKLRIIYDPKNPGHYSYDSLPAILCIPILLISAGLIVLALGRLMRAAEKPPEP